MRTVISAIAVMIALTAPADIVIKWAWKDLPIAETARGDDPITEIEAMTVALHWHDLFPEGAGAVTNSDILPVLEGGALRGYRVRLFDDVTVRDLWMSSRADRCPVLIDIFRRPPYTMAFGNPVMCGAGPETDVQAYRGYSSNDKLLVFGTGSGRMADYGESAPAPYWREKTDIVQVLIGTNVTRIGSYAFHGCSNLTSVVLHPTVPPSIGANAFDSTVTSILVPEGSVPAYEEAWPDYASRISGHDYRPDGLELDRETVDELTTSDDRHSVIIGFATVTNSWWKPCNETGFSEDTCRRSWAGLLSTDYSTLPRQSIHAHGSFTKDDEVQCELFDYFSR